MQSIIPHAKRFKLLLYETFYKFETLKIVTNGNNCEEKTFHDSNRLSSLIIVIIVDYFVIYFSFYFKNF